MLGLAEPGARRREQDDLSREVCHQFLKIAPSVGEVIKASCSRGQIAVAIVG